MKTLITLIIIFMSFIATAFSQEDYCKECDWNHLIKDDSNWRWLKAGGGIGTMYYFLGQSHINTIPDLDDIAEYQDYTNENGWHLLYKDFGCDGDIAGVRFPYFLLYNKYTGIIRLFTYLPTEEFSGNPNGGIVTLRFTTDSKRTSLLTHTNDLGAATSKYHPLNASINDIGTVFLRNGGNGIDDTFVPAHWCVADFQTAFDHKTPREVEPGIVAAGDYEVIFDFDQIQESTFVVDGFVNLITSSFSGNMDESEIHNHVDDPDTPEDESSIKDYLTDASKITKRVPSESALRKVFEDQKQELLTYESTYNSNFGNTKISQTTKIKLDELSNDTDNKFTDFLLGVSKYAPIVGKYLETAAGVFDFFSGKANTTPQKVDIMPTITKGNLKLSGKITNKSGMGNVTLELPGTPHSQANQTPYYDCPLGIIGLEEEPSLEFEQIKYRYALNIIGNCEYLESYNTYISARITEDLKIALNKSVDLNVIDLKAALAVKSAPARVVNYDHDPTYSYRWCNYSQYTTWNNKNPIMNYLNNGFYNLNSVNKNNVVYSTPFIDVENFKHTSIIYPKDGQVFLKILAILETNDPEANDTPIKFTASYKLTEPTSLSTVNCIYPENLQMYAFPFTRSQLANADITQSEILTTLENRTINYGNIENYRIEAGENVTVDASSNTIDFNAYQSIHLKPGFSVTASNGNSFKAQIIDDGDNVIASNNTSIENILTPYFQNDDCGSCSQLKNAKLSKDYRFDDLKKDAENSMYDPIVYPNPTISLVNIKNAYVNSEVNSKLEIYNSIGHKIFEEHINSFDYKTDISNFAKGIYVFKITSNYYSTKILKVIKK